MGLTPKFGLWLEPKATPKPNSKYHKKSKLVNRKGKQRKAVRCPPRQQIQIDSLKRFLRRHNLTKVSGNPLIGRV